MKRVPGIYHRGRVWWIAWYDPAGHRHREAVGPSYSAALRVRRRRLDGIEGTGKAREMTFRDFVETHWRTEVAITLKASTVRGYNTALEHHLLPAFGDYPLSSITRAVVKAFIAEKVTQRRWSYSIKRPNPNRPTLPPKTIKNAVGLLVSVLESASADYGFLDENPIQGMLRRSYFPVGDHRLPVRILEPDAFGRAVVQLGSPVREVVLFAALTGLRWGEQVALRIPEDIDLRRNRLHITRALYRRVSQTPKTQQSVRDVDLCPTVRRILQAVSCQGFVFSEDGKKPLVDGSYVKRQWRAAQVKAKVGPIRWHDLRHQFVSLMILAGKHPKYIASQVGHASAGFTLDRYGHLFETAKITPVE